jgi:protein-disulfide isomerase
MLPGDADQSPGTLSLERNSWGGFVNTIARLWILTFVCLPAVGQVTPAASTPSPSSVVAEVDGRTLTSIDLEQRKSGSLLQARYQYYTSQRKALDQLVDEELLALAAERQHLTAEELLEKKVYKDIKDPTEDQLQVYYEGMESNEPYPAVRDRVLEHIRELRRDKARAAYIKELRSQARLRILLSPPVAGLNLENALVRGSKDAPVQLVEFADYECPYCQQVNPLIQKLQEEYGDKLSFAYKDFPLPMHHRSQNAAEASRCAGEQGKYWEYHDVLYYSRMLDVNDLKKHAQVLKLDEGRFAKCLDEGKEAEAVKKDLEEGKKMGLPGTPSFFVNGHYFHGSVDYSTLKEMVDQQLPARSSPQAVAQAASTK